MVPTVVLILNDPIVQQHTHQVVVAEEHKEQQHIILCHVVKNSVTFYNYTVGWEILDCLIFHILNLHLDLIFVKYSTHAYSTV